MMTTQQIAALLLGTEGDLIGLNDWAVNTVREYCRGKGYNPGAVVAEERERIHAATCALGLADYLKARRIGSRHLLSRKIRRAVWVALATRKILEKSC
jgi:hypothetical protein